jgi:hypothetical protein
MTEPPELLSLSELEALGKKHRPLPISTSGQAPHLCPKCLTWPCDTWRLIATIRHRDDVLREAALALALAREGLLDLVDNACGYDKSIVRALALRARTRTVFDDDLIDRVLRAEARARAILAGLGDDQTTVVC